MVCCAALAPAGIFSLPGSAMGSSVTTCWGAALLSSMCATERSPLPANWARL